MACICFGSCNLFIGEVANLGIGSINYFNSGSLLFAVVYFISKREWSRKNESNVGLLDARDPNARKVLLRTWTNNKFDWHAFALILVGCAF